MTDSHAEQLDATKLGEEIGDADLASDEFPAETPMAVDDKTIVRGGVIARDDVATRDARRTDDDRAEADSPGLIETSDDPDIADDERQLIAESGDRERSPEAEAVRVTDE
jgi:hypothetical protein